MFLFWGPGANRAQLTPSDRRHKSKIKVSMFRAAP